MDLEYDVLVVVLLLLDFQDLSAVLVEIVCCASCLCFAERIVLLHWTAEIVVHLLGFGKIICWSSFHVSVCCLLTGLRMPMDTVVVA